MLVLFPFPPRLTFPSPPLLYKLTTSPASTCRHGDAGPHPIHLPAFSSLAVQETQPPPWPTPSATISSRGQLSSNAYDVGTPLFTRARYVAAGEEKLEAVVGVMGDDGEEWEGSADAVQKREAGFQDQKSRAAHRLFGSAAGIDLQERDTCVGRVCRVVGIGRGVGFP
jgi:hypothetical protein